MKLIKIYDHRCNTSDSPVMKFNFETLAVSNIANVLVRFLSGTSPGVFLVLHA